MEHSSRPDRTRRPFHWDAVDDALTNVTPKPTADPATELSTTLRGQLSHSYETPGDLETGFEALRRRIQERSGRLDGPSDAHAAAPQPQSRTSQRRFPPPYGAGRMMQAFIARQTGTARRVAFGAAAIVAGAAVLMMSGRRTAFERTSVSARQYSTMAGERASITLADGSQVMLGPSSLVRVASGFGGRSRAVSVQGTVMFSVSHADAAPFVVTAGDVQVRVLGTTFSVRHYERDTSVTVAVRSGRVAVGSTIAGGALPIVAQANEVAVVLGGRASVRPAPGDVERLTAWTSGRLAFEDTPLRDALPELERWYDVSFRLSDSSLADIRVTGGFQSQGIDDLEEALRFILPLTVRRSGRTITLSR